MFRAGDLTVTFPPGTIPSHSYLGSLLNTKFAVQKDDNGAIILQDIDPDHLVVIHAYLVHDKIPSPEYTEVLDFFGISLSHSYGLSQMRENNQRMNMYTEEYKDDQINTDPHYGLTKLTKNLWDSLRIDRGDPTHLLFNKKVLNKQSWEQARETLSKINNLFTEVSDKIFVAGGYILSALFGYAPKDIDIFMFDVTAEQAEAIIIKLASFINGEKDKKQRASKQDDFHSDNSSSDESDNSSDEESDESSSGESDNSSSEESDNSSGEEPDESSDDEQKNTRTNLLKEIESMNKNEERQMPDILRTKHAVTIIKYFNGLTDDELDYTMEYQVILRLYRKPSEILHGFDVDCCSIGYDGTDLWITDRALYSLMHGYNTVNFDRLSPSYEARLIKYGARGFSINVPNFTRDLILPDKIQNKYAEYVADRKGALIKRYTPFLEYKGLDRLLMMEMHLSKRMWNKQTVRIVEDMADVTSDYCPVPYNVSEGTQQRHLAIDNITYLCYTRHAYPEKSKNYWPWLRMYDIIWYTSGEYYNGLVPNGMTREEYIAGFFSINKIRKDGTFDFVKFERDLMATNYSIRTYLRTILHLPEFFYNGLGAAMPWTIPRDIEFKTVNPGEQTTGTFHRLVLEDRNVWYNGQFYKIQ